ncbi:hypothetical protein DNK56_04320 [Streptomyces sp. AC1-42W]|nr:hypothetical protein DNK55_27250 [Streptomyces sp. AC1-42T]PZT81416.1 hypothetical protein DNK56_04320 [Streptomyces sp. AC1-42W]
MITAQRRPNKLRAAPPAREAAGRGRSAWFQRGFIYFWPLYTGTPIPEDSWRDRMWLDTWI